MYCGWEGGEEPRRYEAAGFGSATFREEGHHRSWSYPDMSRCRCQSPPAWADGGAWRSSSPAAGLPQPGMSGGVLDLCALRPRAMLLLRRLPRGSTPPAMPCGQPPLPAESGRPTRSSRPPTGLPGTPRSASRDGSIFLFGHFSGTIRLWRNDHDADGGRAATAGFGRAGKAGRSVAALLDLWPVWPLRRSFPPHFTTKVSQNDLSRNPRTDPPLFLR